MASSTITGPDTTAGSGDDRPRGVSLAPRTMVDPVAEWPLRRVVDHLKKKEQDDTERPQIVRVHCRSTVKLLLDVMDELAVRYGISRSRLCRYLSYHGLALAQDDLDITRMEKAESTIRRVCLQEDDTDTLDMMHSHLPYTPRIVDDTHIHLPMYDWVASAFDGIAQTCGVYKYHVVQAFMLKSVLSDDLDDMGVIVPRLDLEVSRWDTWMGFRLGALEALVDRKTGGSIPDD